MPTDNVLKLYSKTIQSSFLHYGFWDDPENIDLSTLSLQDIRNAQYRYIDHLASFIPSETKTILDVGCGGGLLSEPMCRLGAQVFGIDASEKNIKIAKTHSEKNGLKINYLKLI